MIEFKSWPKIPRLVNDVFVITEKLDGTNGQILIHEDGTIDVGSRNKWLSSGKGNDNFGFYDWIQERKEKILVVLSPGRYYGEFIGKGIQRGYNLDHRRFYIFRTDLEIGSLEEIDIYPIPSFTECDFTSLPPELDISTVTGVKPFTSRVNNYPFIEGVIVQSKLTGARWKYFIYEEVPKDVEKK